MPSLFFEKHKSPKKGFTLVELLLVIAIISIIGAASAPYYQSFSSQNNLGISANVVARCIKRAEVLAQATDGDVTWGCFIQTSQVTVFKGNSYASRDANYDDITAFPATISFSGNSEFIFNKMSGEPTTTGSTTITVGGKSRVITMNSKGVVSY